MNHEQEITKLKAEVRDLQESLNALAIIIISNLDFPSGEVAEERNQNENWN